MSLLFCIWADQDEEKSDPECSGSENGEDKVNSDEENVDNEKDDIENVEEKEKDGNDGREADKKAEKEANLLHSGDQSPSGETVSTAPVNQLPRKKPFIGPKSVMKRYRELEEQREREKAKLAGDTNVADQIKDPNTELINQESVNICTPSTTNVEINVENKKDDSADGKKQITGIINETGTTPKDSSPDESAGTGRKHEFSVARKSTRIRRPCSRQSIFESEKSTVKSTTKKRKCSQDDETVGKNACKSLKSKRNTETDLNIKDGKKPRGRKPSIKNTEILSQDDNAPNSNTDMPARRELLKRKARPHTFSHIYDMDPSSPFLYTSERRKGPGVSLEFDKDEDVPDRHQAKEVEDNNDTRDQDDEKCTSTKRIKVEPRSKSPSPFTLQRPTKTEQVQSEFVSYGISLESVFSLADCSEPRRNMAEPVIIKQEPIDEWDSTQYVGQDESDPLGDPLAIRPADAPVKASFNWPRLDPLFLTVIEFKLSKEYDTYIKALAKPTAEILPIPKETSVIERLKINSQYSGLLNSKSISITQKSSPEAVKANTRESCAKSTETQGVRRSVRKRTDKIDLKNLFSESSDMQLNRSDRRKSKAQLPVSLVTPQTNSISATLSRFKSSGITVTQVKSSDEEVSNCFTSCQKEQSATNPTKKSTTGINCLKLTNVPWLPSNWKASMATNNTTDGRPNTTLTFVSPDGTVFHNRQAVLDYLRKNAEDKSAVEILSQPTIKREVISNKISESPRETSQNSVQPTEEPSSSTSNPPPTRTLRRTRLKSKAVPDREPAPGPVLSDANQELSKSGRIQEKYETLCKPGEFTCPICYTVFRLNQTYGRHVVSKECKIIVDPNSPRMISLNKAPWILDTEDPPNEDDDVQVLEENVRTPPVYHISVIKSTVEEDSYVECGRVPSLTLLSRGALPCGGLLRVPISVKEGLQYYHSLVWKENNEDTFFEKLCDLTKISISLRVKSFEKICKEPLKVALYLERKISSCRENKGPHAQRTRDWVEKYEKFLRLPLHDLFLSLVSNHRVIEYCDLGSVCVLCLNCPDVNCNGCFVVQTHPKKPGEKKKLRIPIRVKSSGTKECIASSQRSPSCCGICEGCRKPNCRECTHCLDMVKYGGQGLLKKKCLKRVCVQVPNRGFNSTTSDAATGQNRTQVRRNCEGVTAPLSKPYSKSKNSSQAAGKGNDPTDKKAKRPAYKITRILPSTNLNKGLRPYPCTVCRVGFPTRIEMIAHRSEAHKNKRKAPAETRKSNRRRMSVKDDAFEKDLQTALSRSQEDSI